MLDILEAIKYMLQVCNRKSAFFSCNKQKTSLFYIELGSCEVRRLTRALDSRFETGLKMLPSVRQDRYMSIRPI